MILRAFIYTLSLIAISLAAYAQQPVVEYSYIVHRVLPHAEDSYTQGLEFAGGELYESTGQYGESRLLRVDLESGETKTLSTLSAREFGEGLTVRGDTIYMLTWRENTLYMFNRHSGEKIGRRSYVGEGWGLTSDGQRLYMSDGSNYITVRDPKSFAPLSSHSIWLNGRAVNYLNELEWIDGRIWANIYQTNHIVIIDPESWSVVGVVDLTGLLPEGLRKPKTDVLNGIARDPKSGKIYVTGKYWPTMYEIEIIAK